MDITTAIKDMLAVVLCCFLLMTELSKSEENLLQHLFIYEMGTGPEMGTFKNIEINDPKTKTMS